jgi:hypothetical protein
MEAAAHSICTQRLRIELGPLQKDSASLWSTELEVIGDVIDTFLAPRFDWQIESEVYPWQEFDPSPSIVLKRNADPRVQNISRVLASKQFPGSCQNQRMLVINDYGRFIGSFAAQMLDGDRVIDLLLGLEGSPILGIYNGENWVMEPQDSTFCEVPSPSGTGPRNRWLCFFLPITNCSVEGDYRHDEEGEGYAATNFLVNASDSMAPPRPRRKNSRLGSSRSWRDMMEHVPLKSNAQVGTPKSASEEYPDLFHSMQAVDKMGLKASDEGKGAIESFDDVNMKSGFLLRDFLYRRNYRFRARVAQEIAGHQQLREVADGKTDCIGMHIRRGDKVDESYWCHLVDPYNPAYQQAPGFNRTFGEVVDIAASLETKILPDLHRKAQIFIATDNQTYVNQQLQHANASLRRQVLSLGGQDNLFETKDGRLAQQAVYWASQDIAAGCKGIVINRVSQSSKVMEWMACSRQGHCPLVEDLGKGRPQEEVDAARLAWDAGLRPDGFHQRCGGA